MGLKTRICVKARDSIILLGCYEARKEGNHWTNYESGERTRIETNHTSANRVMASLDNKSDLLRKEVLIAWREELHMLGINEFK